MSIPSSLTPLFNSGSSAATPVPPYAGLQISRSLRFNSADSAYLSRTPAVAGNRQKWTWAGWVKIASFARTHFLFGAENTFAAINANGTSSDCELYFNLRGSSTNYFVSYAPKLRDPSAWYHLVFAVDTTQGTPANILKVYINGVQATAAGGLGQSFPPQNDILSVNNTVAHTICGSYYFDGYLADVYFIDDQALTPSSFGQTDTAYGNQWVPIAYAGTYGTNGFSLKFSDNSAATAATLGKDYSGNSNNWTPNNLNVLSSYTDTFLSRKPDGTSWTNPTNAFDGTTANYADGTYNNGTISTIRFNKPLTGVTLLEYFYDGTSTYGYNSTDVGTGPNLTGGSYVTVYSGSSTTINNVRCTSQPGNGVIRLYAIRVNGTILNGWTETDPPGNDSLVDTPTSFGTDTGVGGEVRGNYATWNPLALVYGTPSLSNGNLDSAKNNSVCVSTIGIPTSGKWYCEVSGTDVTGGICPIPRTVAIEYNLGSGVTGVIGIAVNRDADEVKLYKDNVLQSTTNISSGGIPTSATAFIQSYSGGTLNAGQRAFAYTAPSGFKALCDTNLPAPLTAKPNTVFDVVAYAGSSSPLAITLPGGFSPNLVWLKCRSLGNYHWLTDTVRGTNKQLSSNDTISEESRTDRISSFDASGFTVANHDVNSSGNTFVAWCWDAGEGSAVSNGSGSITSQVRANVSAGFSIATFTTNSSSGNATIGHGLGVAPKFVIVKSRNATYNWDIYHGGISNAKDGRLIFTTAAFTTSFVPFGGVDPTSSVFTLSQSFYGTGIDCVAYCFAPVSGYSNGFSYTGNGSNSGTFVYLGFRPRFFFVKRTDAAGDWWMYDAARNPYNVTNYALRANSSAAEVSDVGLDMLSNGFRYVNDTGAPNISGATYVGFAFAESPFQYARAR